MIQRYFIGEKVTGTTSVSSLHPPTRRCASRRDEGFTVASRPQHLWQSGRISAERKLWKEKARRRWEPERKKRNKAPGSLPTPPEHACTTTGGPTPLLRPPPAPQGNPPRIPGESPPRGRIPLPPWARGSPPAWGGGVPESERLWPRHHSPNTLSARQTRTNPSPLARVQPWGSRSRTPKPKARLLTQRSRQGGPGPAPVTPGGAEGLKDFLSRNKKNQLLRP